MTIMIMLMINKDYHNHIARLPLTCLIRPETFTLALVVVIAATTTFATAAAISR